MLVDNKFKDEFIKYEFDELIYMIEYFIDNIVFFRDVDEKYKNEVKKKLVKLIELI